MNDVRIYSISLIRNISKYIALGNFNLFLSITSIVKFVEQCFFLVFEPI